MATKPDKKTKKLTIEEYTKRREMDANRRFKISFYPWPVLSSLLLPLIVFLFMVAAYFFYIRTSPP